MPRRSRAAARLAQPATLHCPQRTKCDPWARAGRGAPAEGGWPAGGANNDQLKNRRQICPSREGSKPATTELRERLEAIPPHSFAKQHTHITAVGHSGASSQTQGQSLAARVGAGRATLTPKVAQKRTCQKQKTTQRNVYVSSTHCQSRRIQYPDSGGPAPELPGKSGNYEKGPAAPIQAPARPQTPLTRQNMPASKLGADK